MFDQHAEESFNRTEKRTVNHKRPMLQVIFARIFQLEALRQIKIQLNRAQLPNTTDGVLDLNIDFRSVKCGLAFDSFVRNIPFAKSICQRFFSTGPVFVRPEIPFILGRTTNRKLELHAVEAVGLKHLDRKF